MKVLVVEDKPKMAALLRRAFRGEGVLADVATCGEYALWMAAATRYDSIVLDVMLPGIDGIETCRRLRGDGVWTPVLMLTARGALADRVAGLDGGADDYLAKPFELPELMARLRALVRREPIRRPTILEVGDLRLDPATRQVWRCGHPVELSPKTFALLEVFMRRPRVVLSRYELLEAAWEGDFDHRSNVVDQHVRLLRQRIDRPFGRQSIETVRGSGYRLRDGTGR
jgi:two-component system OmpR family response regulator